MSYRRLVLPYVVEDVNRKGRPFSFDMEVAAIVCLAEAQRKKPGFLGGPPERIIFVSKVHYPLWAVPWGDRCLIVDGLGFSSYDGAYLRPPDVRLFTEDLKRNSVVREEFRSVLRKHAETFKDFVARVDFSLSGLVANRSLLHSLLKYLKQGSPLDEKAEPVVAPIKLGREDALETCEKFVQHWRQVQADIKGFQYALSVLDEETKLHERGILCEIEHLREKYENEISSLKPVVEKKIKKLTAKREAEIARMTRAADKRLKAAAKEKEKYERRLQRLERNAFLFQKKVEAFKRKGNKPKVARWSYELKKCRGEISAVKSEIKAASRLIERILKENEKALKELEEGHRNLVEQEQERITNLMALRDSEIAAKRKELEELRLESSRIADLIEQLIERKRLRASKLKEEITIPWENDEVTLIHLPFYLVKYEKDGEARYRVHPPTIATDYKGVLMAVQKAIRSFSLESRIKLLLRPRSEELGEMLSSALTGKMREDKAFEGEMSEICRSNNLLNLTDFKEVLTKGMRELREEGWVKPAEARIIAWEYGGIR